MKKYKGIAKNRGHETPEQKKRRLDAESKGLTYRSGEKTSAHFIHRRGWGQLKAGQGIYDIGRGKRKRAILEKDYMR